jgi:hypothetical protein
MRPGVELNVFVQVGSRKASAKSYNALGPQSLLLVVLIESKRERWK